VRVRQPRLAPVTWVVTELEAGRSFTWRAASAGLVLSAGHEVLPGPAGTSTIRLSIDQTGVLAGPVALLYGGTTRRYVRMEAEGLAAAAADLTGA
jgi:hypothetical protein